MERSEVLNIVDTAIAMNNDSLVDSMKRILNESLSDIKRVNSENDVLDLDSSSVTILKSLTHCEFVSGQHTVCSVCGNLAKCYQEWMNIGGSF